MHPGQRVRQLRVKRGMSQETLAGLASVTKGYISQLERGLKPLDRLSLIQAIAEALQVGVEALTSLALPNPYNGPTDAAVDSVRQALSAVEVGHPGGEALPVDVLRGRVIGAQRTRYGAGFRRLGEVLPSLIRDTHSTVKAGRDLDEVLELAVLFHVDVVGMWLRDAWAGVDLRSRSMALAQQLAERQESDNVVATAAFGLSHALIVSGAAPLAASVLRAAPKATAPGLRGAILGTHGRIAAVSGGDPDAAMGDLADLARHTGEIGMDPYGFAQGPIHVGIERMVQYLESGEPHKAIRLARDINPDPHPYQSRRAAYWTELGRAHAQLGHRDAAVSAFLKAERIMPVRVHRNNRVVGAVRALREGALRDSTGENLFALAARMGVAD